ncbi:unnamed protein product [Urochloa humidicola]
MILLICASPPATLPWHIDLDVEVLYAVVLQNILQPQLADSHGGGPFLMERWQGTYFIVPCYLLVQDATCPWCFLGSSAVRDSDSELRHRRRCFRLRVFNPSNQSGG